MRRLNHCLVVLVLDDLARDTLAILPQQLQQATRSCCYDSDSQQSIAEQGTIGANYGLLLNTGWLLSIVYISDINGVYS